MTYTVAQIAEILNGSVEGDESLVITSAAKIDEAQEGNISFISNPKYGFKVYNTRAAAVLVGKSLELDKSITATLLRVENVDLSKQKLLGLFKQEEVMMEGVSTNASVEPSSIIDAHVYIGDYSVVGYGAKIGERTIIYPQVYIGREVSIGANCKIYAGVRIEDRSVIGDNVVIHPNAVIGSDGFGFAPDAAGAFHKVIQAGNVIIEDNVEIGSNTVIDRATLGSTIIRKGVKLDNLIQIAHNVEIKQHTVIAAQTGVAGSTIVGANSQIGGQVGIVGHIQLADGIQIQAQSGVAASIEDENSKWYGTPAIKYFNYLRSFAIFKRLPFLQKEINEMKNEISQLRNTQEGQDI